MRDKILSQSGKDYWRSVDEFVDAPEFEEFVKREYPVHSEDWDNAVSRRTFVKLMGGTLALAGLSGCVIQPPEKIVPYVRAEQDLLPGRPLFFATAMSIGGVATGLLAKSFDGRPVKLEGNPGHPGNLGATDVRVEASLLEMYDPDRSQEVSFRGTPKTWQNLIATLRSSIEENRADGGAGIRFLTETVTSPTLLAQFRQISTELPNSRWYQYEPLNNDNAIAGARMAFGSPVQTIYKFDLADRILTLDKDIFSDFNIRYKKDYAKKKNLRGDNKEINRLYAVETTMTLTGAKADHRIGVKPSQMPEVAKAIAAALGVTGATSTYTENAQWIAAMARDLQGARGRSVVVPGANQPAAVHALAHAMNAALGNVGQTVVYADPFTPSEKTQIEQLRELVGDIDAGRVKMLVIMGANPVYNTPADLKLDANRMNKVPLRVHLGKYFDETAELCHWHVSEKHFLESWGDTRAYDGTVSLVQPLIQPLYDSHSIYEVAQLFFRENFDQRDYDIVRAYWQTQNIGAGRTAAAATTAAGAGAQASPAGAQANPNDRGVNTSTGRVNQANAVSAQTAPNAPIAGAGTGTGSSTAGRTGGSQNAGAQAGAGQNSQAGAAATFEDNWRRCVHDGVVPNTTFTPKTVSVNTGFLAQPVAAAPNNGPLEISIWPDPSVYDGRFANNGWLQELPKPLTKITWENVAFVSPRTAARLGLNQSGDDDQTSGAGGERPVSFVNSKGSNMFSDLVTLSFQGVDVSKPVPVWIAPGQPDDVVTIFTGYGRTRGGRVANGLGYNAYEVMRSDAMNSGTGNITATGAQTTIASTQIHFNMEGRDILRVWDVNNLEHEAKRGEQEDHYDESMYRSAAQDYQKQYDKHNRWGMAIDLNSCIGCNACVLACQSENNIPVVGKEQVERSREMHWLRIDAYYGGKDLSEPDGPHFQPVLCQQCEQAPCEVVCPVTATVHNAEGLNDMVYNRCVGTRYCSNNCPYKVRRFNFMLYQDWDTPQYKLMRNPEVTIRSRGVMEKCTYCTQRIAAARIEAEKDARPISDGEVITACQAACPTDAIIFGDMNDKESQVMKLKNDPRNYRLLNELNTQPRTTYLAELKNQNREMPDYKEPKPDPDKEHKEGTASEGSEGPVGH
ncbi:MAG TPA: TAT-variant-translocated molybdopterin oxidoreductase [Pyrinomonadaceae bacterium]|nr:TAT-variant-translocated molybdopterin oxidoreductase [Pyrinomonadaceae bacterium]